jgi:hypothetical protein
MRSCSRDAQPRVRDINDLLDQLNANGGNIDCYAATRGDVRLAAAALSAYCRQLPTALVAQQELDLMFNALEIDDFAHRVAGVRDSVSQLPEAHQAVLHRLCYFLHRLGGAHVSPHGHASTAAAEGNELAELAQFWANMLMPQSNNRPRVTRVKEYRLVGLMLQQSQCIFGATLETYELPELPLPQHLVEEEAQAEAARKQWVRIKASLLRDSRGQFKIGLLEDRGGIHFNKIERSDVRTALDLTRRDLT